LSDLVYGGGGSGGGSVTVDYTVDTNIFNNINSSNHGYSSPAAYQAHLDVDAAKSQAQVDWSNFKQVDTKLSGWSTKLDGSTWTIRYKTNSNLFHSAFSSNDILQQFGDPKNAINPYSKKVATGYTEEYGKKTYSYIDNPAYTEFENLVKNLQTIEYSDELKANTDFNSQVKQQKLNMLTDGHDNGLYGAGTLGIDALAQNIVSLEEQINDLEMADALSSDYSRIDNTDHSREIETLQAQLGEFQKQYASAINDYNSRYAIAKAKQNEASKGEWDVHFFWMVDPTFDAGGSVFNPTIRQDTNGFSNLLLSGDINSWMAGGSLYDAPRAGDVMFNVMGNMNTVRFLGLEDTNKIPDMGVEFANPEVFRMLGNMAGDNNFSVIPPTMYS